MILLFCGPPSVGKSTIIKELLPKLEDAVVLCSDDFKTPRYVKMFRAAQKLLQHKYLILDATFFKKKYRDMFAKLGKNKIIYLKASLQTLLERNKTRKQPIPERGIYAIAKGFEEPDADVVVDTEKVGVKAAAKQILKLLK